MRLKGYILLLLILLGFGIVFDLLSVILFAGIVAYIFMPAVNYLEKKIRKRWAAASIVFLLAGALVIAPIFSLAKSIVDSRLKIISYVSTAVQYLENYIYHGGLSEYSGELTKNLIDSTISDVGAQISNIPMLFVSLFVFLVLLFYFLRDGPILKSYIYRLARRTNTTFLVKKIKDLMDGVLFGFLMIAVLKGFLAYIVFALLGIDFAVLLAMGITVLAVLPILGSELIYIPLIIIQYLAGNIPAAGAILIYSLVSEISVFFYIQPKILGKRTTMHPALMLLGILGGILFMGGIGFVVGPIALGITKLAFDNYMKK